MQNVQVKAIDRLAETVDHNCSYEQRHCEVKIFLNKPHRQRRGGTTQMRRVSGSHANSTKMLPLEQEMTWMLAEAAEEAAIESS